MESNIEITVRGDVDARAVEQLKRCAVAGDALAGVLCADGHVGYSQPIGGALAYADFISFKGEQGAKDAGKMRAEGKEYIVKDGDVLNFLFNV